MMTLPRVAPQRPTAHRPAMVLLLLAMLLTSLAQIQGPPLPRPFTPAPPEVIETALPAPGELLSRPEVVALREEYARHYDLGDGRYVAITSLTPLNYRDRRGSWQPIDPAFAPVPGGFEVRHNSLRSSLAGRGTALQLESAGVELLWQPQALAAGQATLATPLAPAQAAPGALEAGGLAMRYAGAWSDPSLVERFQSAPGAIKQELVLAGPPPAQPGAEWLELRATLSAAAAVQIYAGGTLQAGAFTTAGPVELRAPDGTALLQLAAPLAYEEGRPETAVAGRYQVSREAGVISIAVQTPLGWWLDPQRQYPAVLDPTMQVVKDLQNAHIFRTRNYEPGVDGEPLGGPSALNVDQRSTCVGHYVTRVNEDTVRRGYRRGYVRFPLPNLPYGVSQPSAAYVVAVPDHTFSSDPTYTYYGDRTTRQPTYLLPMGQDWTDDLLGGGVTTVPDYPAGMAAPSAAALGLLRKPSPGLTLAMRPATLWDVGATVQGWYGDPASNHGFALRLHYEQFYAFETPLPVAATDPDGTILEPFTYPTFACFPSAAGWSNLDQVVANLGSPAQAAADAPGLGMLVLYEAPALAGDAYELTRVPSTVPLESYRHQYHEYRLPNVPGRWRAVAARGFAPSSVPGQGGDPVDPNVPLDLVGADGRPLDPPVGSDMGQAAAVNRQAGYDYAPNYVLVDGNAGEPRVRVQADNKPTNEYQDNKRYHLQHAVATLSPPPAPFGTAITATLDLERIVALQELELVGNSTVEILVPYASFSYDAPTRATADMYDLQVFPPGLTYASRQQGGARVTPGPDAYEIEFSIPAGMGGRWLLVAAKNFLGERTTLQARVTACENSDAVVRYPLDGECVELRRPPAGFSADPAHYKELGSGAGRLRVYSPAGFDCAGAVCTTRQRDGANIPAMPLIGHGDDDLRWVALKSGSVSLDAAAGQLTTAADTRLIMADFGGQAIVSLPVLRGAFAAQPGSGGQLLATSQPADTHLLVKSPMPTADDNGGVGDKNGWGYRVDLAGDRLVAEGPVVRRTQPSVGGPTTTFSFAAGWSISAHGGPSLQGQLSPTGIAPSATFKVGTLIVTAPGGGYAFEHAPADASPGLPAATPLFRQVRVSGASVAQPPELGGARLPVQAVLLHPDAAVKDDEGDNPSVQCGPLGHSCFDLRGPEDTMGPGGPLVDRDYRMPDLIVQDSANTVMMQSAGRLEVLSTDHPLAGLAGADDFSFSYEAFEGSVRTYSGQCPLARDPLNPSNPPGGEGPTLTLVEGTALMSLPNLSSEVGSGDASPRIQVSFTLCEDALREMSFSFDTGAVYAIPIGNSGLFMNFIGGTVSLAPKQQGQAGYTTVVLEVQFRGMTPQLATSDLRLRGRVTIDSRGLFEVQVQAGVRVLGVDAVGVDGRFWVAWSPLDLGFIVQACVPPPTTDPAQFPYPATMCAGNELLFGELKAHMWQGQGWQNRYPWLADNDDLHVTARFEARLTVPSGAIVDAGPVVIPPGDVTLAGIKLAFGEFCTNSACTSYEWGIMGAFVLLGYDVGFYYGFDSGLSFIMGSADYLLIDEAGAAQASPALQARRAHAGEAHLQAVGQQSIPIAPGIPSAMFGIAGSNASVSITLHEPAPGGRTITAATNAPDVYIDKRLIPGRGYQSIITVRNPLPGDWQVTVDTGTASTHSFFYFANRAAPQLTVSPLPAMVENVATVPLSWTSSVAPGSEARVSFYFEALRTTAGVSGVESAGPIVERLELAPSGSYAWDVSGLASGLYRIYARVDNAAAAVTEGCAGQTYSADPRSQGPCGTMLNSRLLLPVERVDVPGLMELRDTVPPAPPTGLQARAEGISNVAVRWLPSSRAGGGAETDLAGYVVTCTQSALTRSVRVRATLPSGATAREIAQVNGLDGTVAGCSVQAYDASGNLSGPSAVVTAQPGLKPPPLPAVQGLAAAQAAGDGALVVSWQATPGAAGYLLFYQREGGAQARALGLTAVGLPAGQGYGRAAEGRSPLDVGGATSARLTGLAPGRYTVWAQAYDGEGRNGARGAPIQLDVGPVAPLHRVYAPLVVR